MTRNLPRDASEVPELGEAVELVPRVWWVGSMLPGDDFQCHVYLIEQGDQSVLIDPGSALTVDEVASKVASVVPLDHVRWLVCSHSDPDIIAALPTLAEMGLHPDAAIVTHWRDEALIRHIGIDLPFWLIEDHDWHLDLEDRRLRFVFTPYAHFPGAFATFDEATATLFSGDLFGGFSTTGELFATSMDHFEGIRAFHQHYMPSREVLAHALDQIAELEIDRIAPQHGRIIPKNLVEAMCAEMRELDCGLYLFARTDPGLAFLLAANDALREITEVLLGEPSFAQGVRRVAQLAQQNLGATNVELWAKMGDQVLWMSSDNDYEGQQRLPPSEVEQVLNGGQAGGTPRVHIPLRSPATDAVIGVAVLDFDEPPSFAPTTWAVLNQVAELIEVGLERELLRRRAANDRDLARAQAIHDPLTGLHNRVVLDDVLARACATDDRNGGGLLATLMIDIDHFKAVNDDHGHQVGDEILRVVSAAIAHSIRPADLAVRYGGEEFLVLLEEIDLESASQIAERLRAEIATPVTGLPDVTASIGLALHQHGEDPQQLIERADRALYRAKETGRDRTVVA